MPKNYQNFWTPFVREFSTEKLKIWPNLVTLSTGRRALARIEAETDQKDCRK